MSVTDKLELDWAIDRLRNSRSDIDHALGVVLLMYWCKHHKTPVLTLLRR